MSPLALYYGAAGMALLAAEAFVRYLSALLASRLREALTWARRCLECSALCLVTLSAVA